MTDESKINKCLSKGAKTEEEVEIARECLKKEE